MTRPDPEGDAARDAFLPLLASAENAGRTIAFWWRDDDAETVTPELKRLLDLAERHDLQLGLAVVPKGATEALAARLADAPKVAVLQHGWQHANHSPAGEKKAEFGDDRPPAEMLSELRDGMARLGALVPASSQPIFVPPWNRIGIVADRVRRDIGLTGISTYGPKQVIDPHQVNTHLDIFEWQTTRGPMSRAHAYAILRDELRQRLDGDPEPIGILSHHLVHEAESWALLEELFALLRHHPAVRWPAIGELFRLARRAHPSPGGRRWPRSSRMRGYDAER